jgi:hypothetical protein
MNNMSNVGLFEVTDQWQSFENLLATAPSGSYSLQNRGNYAIILNETDTEPDAGDQIQFLLYPGHRTNYSATNYSADTVSLYLKTVKFSPGAVEIDMEGVIKIFYI